VTSRILLALCAVTVLIGAESVNPLDQAEVILRVRDGRWVDREATRFAAAYGGDLAHVRGDLARVLYHARSFDGIDLSRPAVIAWRTGKMPLLAVIPVSNRTEFLKAFGAVDVDEPPLVRTGERDGTVIYRQNQPGGEWEYRLLVAGNVAYLARTSEECQQLAAALHVPAHDPSSSPIEVTMRGSAINAPHLPGTGFLADLPKLPINAAELGLVSALSTNAWNAIAGQLTSISVHAQSNAQGDLLLSARFTARPDSTLAAWIANQRPGTERLAGQLRRPSTAVLATGRLTFQGQLERWSFDQAETMRAAAAGHWTDAADGAFRGLCTLIERTGAFAVSVERSGTGVMQDWVVEHPRAIEVVQSAAVVAGALRGTNPELLRIGQRAAFTLAVPDGTSLFVAGDRHATRLDDRGAKRGASAASDLLQRLEEPGSLDTAPSLMAMWIDLALAWNAPPPADGAAAEPVVLSGSLRPAGAGMLELSAELPLAGFGRLLGRMRKITKDE
jgi:hypothetical protein